MLNINGKKICSNCFSPIKSEPCPCCGYKKSSYRPEAGVLPVGSVLSGRYSVGLVLGKGGFGVTYKAYDVKENRAVAVKEYYPNGLVYRDRGTTQISVSSRQYEENFRSGADKFYEEAKTVSRFNGNPNIVNVYEFFYENSTVYYSMEFLDGVDLKHYVKSCGGRISQENALYIVNVITDALLIAHSMNVLHRDISPDNIFVMNDGRIKLIDFGAARQVMAEQSKSLSVILKQGFAPLEQYQRRGKQGPWTDIYALGATLYYILTGKLPDEATERLDYPDIGNAADYGVDGNFWEIIRKCMEVKAADRYQNIHQLKEALNRLDIKPLPIIINGRGNTDIPAAVFPASGTAAGKYAAGPSMPETSAVGTEPSMPETSAVGTEPSMPETVAVGTEPSMPETVAVGTEPSMPETVAVGTEPSMPETVAVGMEPSMPKTSAVEEISPQEKEEPETKKRGLLLFLHSFKGKLITGAAVAVLLLGVVLGIVFAGSAGRRQPVGGNVGRTTAALAEGDVTDGEQENSGSPVSGEKQTENKTKPEPSAEERTTSDVGTDADDTKHHETGGGNGDETDRKPTVGQTQAPATEPTKATSQRPAQKPTEAPTQKPTQKPTEAPTQKPTQKPTEAPTQKPTQKPTEAPTQKPTQPPVYSGPDPVVKPVSGGIVESLQGLRSFTTNYPEYLTVIDTDGWHSMSLSDFERGLYGLRMTEYSADGSEYPYKFTVNFDYLIGESCTVKVSLPDGRSDQITLKKPAVSSEGGMSVQTSGTNLIITSDDFDSVTVTVDGDVISHDKFTCTSPGKYTLDFSQFGAGTHNYNVKYGSNNLSGRITV